MAPQDAGTVESQSAVQGRLAAEREQDAVGPAEGDDPCGEMWRDRQQENAIREARRGLDGGDVRLISQTSTLPPSAP